MCVLMLAAHVATAGAQDVPPPPLVIPAVPTVAVEVSVSVPGVTLIVETGTVDISVSTASVDVSVSASTEGTVSSPEEAGAAPQQTSQPVDSSSCCAGDAKDVASADTSAKATRAPAAKRLGRPTIPAANRVRAHATRVARVDPPKRALTARRGPSHTNERPAATRPAARRGCCEHAQARVVIAAAAQDLGPRPRAEPRPYRFEGTQVRPVAALSEEHVWDNRLLLQLGVVGAFLYLVCLAGWFLRHNAEAEEGMSTRTRP